MEREVLRAALRPDAPADRRLAAALDAGASEHVEAENDAWNAEHVWAVRVRHLLGKGLLVDDPEMVLAELASLAQDATPFTVVNVRQPVPGGEHVFTTLLTGNPPVVRAAFSHRLPDHEG